MVEIEVHELNWESYSVAREVFTGARYDQAHLDAVFEGRQHGRLFVDCLTQPTAGLMCRTYEYFLGGQPDAAICQFVVDAPDEAGIFDTIHDLAAARLAPTVAFYGYVGLNEAWTTTLQQLYGDSLESIGRRTFRFDPDQADVARAWPSRVPEGFRIEPVDAALARRIDEEAGELIGLFWGGYEPFGRESFGACAFHGEEIAGVCYALAVSGTEANFGIETVERFRRRGIATVTAQSCITHALERGLTPTWDCDEPNRASGDLALKVGFAEFPSFVELAFPNRQGPPRSTGIWRSEPEPSGTRWFRDVE